MLIGDELNTAVALALGWEWAQWGRHRLLLKPGFADVFLKGERLVPCAPGTAEDALDTTLPWATDVTTALGLYSAMSDYEIRRYKEDDGCSCVSVAIREGNAVYNVILESVHVDEFSSDTVAMATSLCRAWLRARPLFL